MCVGLEYDVNTEAGVVLNFRPSFSSMNLCRQTHTRCFVYWENIKRTRRWPPLPPSPQKLYKFSESFVGMWCGNSCWTTKNDIAHLIVVGRGSPAQHSTHHTGTVCRMHHDHTNCTYCFSVVRNLMVLMHRHWCECGWDMKDRLEQLQTMHHVNVNDFHGQFSIL